MVAKKAMAFAAGVTGVVNALRKVIRTAQAGRDCLHLVLRQLRSLVQIDHIELHALQPVQIVVARAVRKLQKRSVGECERLVLVVVPCNPKQLFPKDVDVVVDQLGIGSADDQYADAGEPQRKQLCLCSYRPGFSTASRATEANMLGGCFQKERLFFARRWNSQHLHPLYSSSSEAITT